MSNRIRFLVRNLVEAFPILASCYRVLRDNSRLHKKALKTPWGFVLSGNELMASGNFEPDETSVVRRLLDDVDVFVNIGANVGYYCCHALEKNKYVIAFEPMQSNMNLLLKNLYDNGYTSFEVYPLALSDNAGVLPMYGGNTGASLLSGWGGVSKSYSSLVPVTTLDKVLGGRLSNDRHLFVIDVEGAETGVLAGAREILDSSIEAIWLIEIVLSGDVKASDDLDYSKKKVFELFFEKGYRCCIVDEKMREFNAIDLADVYNKKQTVNGHNFLFHKKGVDQAGLN